MKKRTLAVAALIVATCCHEKLTPNLVAERGTCVDEVRRVVSIDTIGAIAKDAILNALHAAVHD